MTPLSSYHHIHLVGIKGVAMASLAQCLDDIAKIQNPNTKIQITGSDVSEDFVTADVLKGRGFEIAIGFDASHIDTDVNLVIYTGAHNGKQNVEVVKAAELGIPVMSHAEALGTLMEGKKAISVCGTGGKSTTSAMIAWILEYAGKKPSYAIGVGNVPNLGCTGKYVADSEWFVAEADEYAVDPTSDHRPRFIYQHPEVIVLTNMRYDHPDIYPDFASMQKVFADFFATLPADGELIRADELAEFAPYELLIPGRHNQLNAEVAMRAARHCGVAESVSREALAKFTSTMRRFEYKGQLGEVELYDDYAHTPDEIRATIQALREWRPGKRVVVAFQPHTYSRTKALFDGFAAELSKADSVILLDIFASAREAIDPTISSTLLAEALTISHSQVATSSELTALLPEILKPGDVFITMGAGDIYTLYEKIHL